MMHMTKHKQIAILYIHDLGTDILGPGESGRPRGKVDDLFGQSGRPFF